MKKFWEYCTCGSKRHWKGIKMYEKGGYGIRTFFWIFCLILALLTIMFSYLTHYFIANRSGLDAFPNILAIIVFVVIFAALFILNLDYNISYAIIAFSLVSKGRTISSAKRQKVANWNSSFPTQSPEYNKKYKGYDIAVGTMLIVFTVASVASSIYILCSNI